VCVPYVYKGEDEETGTHGCLTIEPSVNALVGSKDSENEGDGDEYGELRKQEKKRYGKC
jgi:hypothetical protein